MGGVNGGKLMGGLQADVELHGSGDGCFYRSFTLRPHCGHRPGVVALSLQVAPAMKPGIKDAYLPLGCLMPPPQPEGAKEWNEGEPSSNPRYLPFISLVYTSMGLSQLRFRVSHLRPEHSR